MEKSILSTPHSHRLLSTRFGCYKKCNFCKTQLCRLFYYFFFCNRHIRMYAIMQSTTTIAENVQWLRTTTGNYHHKYNGRQANLKKKRNNFLFLTNISRAQPICCVCNNLNRIGERYTLLIRLQNARGQIGAYTLTPKKGAAHGAISFVF